MEKRSLAPEIEKVSDPVLTPISHLLSQEAGVCEKGERGDGGRGGAERRTKRRGGREQMRDGGKWRHKKMKMEEEGRRWRRKRGGGGQKGRARSNPSPRGCQP